ncbi:hypothetical protein PHLCEN_2v6880 [Hermanssonia centrifuga]|uniref:Bromodomain associated domain-containing protein n=1 Tax=Hermanssonia centrifuga TaxID=98765 RepID=A0A2R6NY81_9APHY|nr:hypothetical protein PHLCEN_2v6880 [Hermanssonia centrifuga]
MDAGAKKLLESVTIEALHAHSFSRSSTQATQVLTDLLSRYLTLLTTTCAKYAEHAGRLRLTARDAVSALGELGVGVEELSEYCAEGRETARYARHTSMRLEDLNEFKANLSIGLREDRDDAFPLVYRELHSPLTSEDEEDESDEDEIDLNPAAKYLDSAMELYIGSESMEVAPNCDPERGATSPRPATPILPLSPISNPSTPPRKRPRSASWHPPEHIPEFLPPFPSEARQTTPLPASATAPSSALHDANPVKRERPTTPPPVLTSTNTADYFRPVPYHLSSLASQPTWHLPTRPQRTPEASPTTLALTAEQGWMRALHHCLTNKTAKDLGVTNPARYNVALELVRQAESSSRWDPAITLYASSAPNVPRVAPIGPVYAIPIAQDEKAAKDKDKEVPESDELPLPPGLRARSIMSTERLAPLVSQYTPKLANLARGALSVPVFSRSTKLSHPPVLSRGTQRLTYGPGVNAPWNSGNPAASAIPPLPNGLKSGREKDKDGKDKDVSAPKPLPDARLYATWSWEQKDHREPLPPSRRARMGSVHLSGSIGNGKRARSENHS